MAGADSEQSVYCQYYYWRPVGARGKAGLVCRTHQIVAGLLGLLLHDAQTHWPCVHTSLTNAIASWCELSIILLTI